MLDDNTIDFVITWVDNTDPSWKSEREKYKTPEAKRSVRKADDGAARYRDWEIIKYFFRSVELYAPWVHRVFFITYGHTPSWLNCANPKLQLVKHEEFIPLEYLPTFSSRTIEFNLHRINELAEKFVLFNDDMLLIDKVSQRDFFVNDFPCDTAVLSPSKVGYGDWYFANVTNTSIINKYFNQHECLLRNPLKWINFRYGISNLRTLSMAPYPSFYGLKQYHLPISYLKQTFIDVWEKEHEILSQTCSHKFREMTDPNQWLFEYFQIASGKFHPRSPHIGKTYYVRNETEANEASNYILKSKGKMVCINDSVSNDEELEQIVNVILDALNRKFPDKSAFEL